MKTNPFYDPYLILSKVYGEGAHLKQALSDTPIEELNRARTVRTVYGVLEEDGYLSLCIRTFAPKAPKLAVRIVLKIALCWLLFLKKPKYMVTDTAVDLLKRMGKGGTAGFVNAFLRNFDEAGVVLPKGDEGLSVRYSFPLFAVRKVRAQYGARAEAILAAKSAGVSVRFVRGEEGYLGRPHTAGPFPHHYFLERFVRDEGFFAGDYTFQSVGSIAVCGVVESCEKLLDACAAPGGKSVLLAERCGHVTACELHPHRVALIEAYASRMHRGNVTAVQADSTVFRPEWEGAFDGVLCDVPCTGLGTKAENPDLPLRKEAADLEGLLPVQRAILENCSRYVRAGGYLYYATCSLLGEENDGAAEAFLAAHPAFSSVPAESPLPHDVTRFGLQFLPDTAYGAGFYVAKFRKEAP